MSVWTDEKVEALKKLWTQPGPALSYGDIGALLGFNRNAIAGKCDRLGLKRGRTALPAARRKASPGAAPATTPSKSKKKDASHPWVQGNERSHRLAKAKAAAAEQDAGASQPADIAQDSVEAPVLAKAVAGKVGASGTSVTPAVKARTKVESSEQILFGDVVPVAAAPDLPIPVGAKDVELDGKPMRGLGLMDLNDRTCHWPVGDPLRPDFFFCGRSIATGDVYCRFHLSVRVSKYQGRSRNPGAPVRALPQQAFA